MDFDPLNIQDKFLAILDRDLPEEEMNEQVHRQLLLVYKTDQPGKNLSSSTIRASDEVCEQSELQEEGEGDLYLSSQGGSSSSLDIYMKTLSRFSPLHEEEEIILAKQIKEREKRCIKLVIKWRGLLKKAYFNKYSTKKTKAITEKFQSCNGTFNLFEYLVKWERKQKKINRELNKLIKDSTTRQALQEELYKVEAEIAKAIAKINLSKTTINRIMRDLKNLSHSKRETKNQGIVKRELRNILKDIDHSSKEIRALKNQLVQAHLRLVIFMAKKHMHRGLSLSDLIQEGNLGLMRAIDTYDYQRCHRFITYATWWVRQAIVRALDCQSRTIRKPIYLNEKLCHIKKASDRLRKECEREPTLKEIAREANVSPESIEKVMQSFKEAVSLDSFIEEKGDSVFNFPKDKKASPIFERVISSNLSQMLDRVLSDLTPREKKVVKLRFGMGATHDHTLEEIGEEFNLTRERIRQILEVALNKLKNPKHMRKLRDFIELN